MKNWFINIIEGNIYQGLEVFELGGDVFYSVLKIQKQKGELHVKLESTFDSLLEAIAQIQGNSLVFLTINTEQVLGKKVGHDTMENPEQLVVSTFPNLDLENFHYQVMDLPDNHYVSICKMEYLSHLLEELKKLGIVPSQIALGISPVQHILGSINQLEIFGSNYKLSNEGDLTSITSNHKGKAELNGLSLEPHSLSSFAQILGYLRNVPQASNLSMDNSKLINDFKNRRIFNSGLLLSLGSFLVVLLLNFLFFSYYQKQIEGIESNIVSKSHQIGLLNTLKERVELKQVRVKAVLGTTNSKSSFYLDRIAMEIPNQIRLDQLVYQPVLKPVREGKSIPLEKNNILISGEVQNKVAFTAWTDTLERKDWIVRTEILSYEYLSQTRDKFSLKVYLDETE